MWFSLIKGRAGQMNYGVKYAKGDVYFFLHADSAPTASVYDVISSATVHTIVVVLELSLIVHIYY
jgi:hypothetical protein